MSRTMSAATAESAALPSSQAHGTGTSASQDWYDDGRSGGDFRHAAGGAGVDSYGRPGAQRQHGRHAAFGAVSPGSGSLSSSPSLTHGSRGSHHSDGESSDWRGGDDQSTLATQGTRYDLRAHAVPRAGGRGHAHGARSTGPPLRVVGENSLPLGRAGGARGNGGVSHPRIALYTSGGSRSSSHFMPRGGRDSRFEGADDASGGSPRVVPGAPVPVTVFNVMKDSFSVSSLALPFVMLQGGPVLCLAMIVVVGAICCHTAKLLAHAQHSCTTAARLGTVTVRPGRHYPGSAKHSHGAYEHVTTYAQLGRATLGAAGEAAVLGVNFVTCVGAGSAWLVAIGAALHEVWAGVSYDAWVVIVAAFTLPLNWLPHVEQLGYASLVSALAFAALIGLIAWMGAADIGVAPGSPDSDEAGFQSAATLFKHPVHWQTTTLLTYGVVKFCFAGHEVFPSIQQSLTPSLAPRQLDDDMDDHDDAVASPRTANTATSPTAALLGAKSRSNYGAARGADSSGLSHGSGGPGVGVAANGDAYRQASSAWSPTRQRVMRDLEMTTHGSPDGSGSLEALELWLAEKGKERYIRTMNLSFALMTLVNCAMATFGYLAFGVAAESNVLVNLSSLRHAYSVLPDVAQVLVATTLTFTIPIVLLAAFEMTEQFLADKWGVGHRHLHWASLYRNTAAAAAVAAKREAEALAAAAGRVARLPSMSELSAAGSDVGSLNSPTLSRHVAKSRHTEDDPIVLATGAAGVREAGFSLLGRITVRTPILALSVVVAVSLPHLGRVVSLVGAVGDSCLGLIFPATFYLIATRQEADAVHGLARELDVASTVTGSSTAHGFARSQARRAGGLASVLLNGIVCAVGVAGIAVGIAGFALT